MTDSPDIIRLADIALDHASRRGVSYCDVRFRKLKNQQINTREDKVTAISDSREFGFGVRVIVDGTWGFASSAYMDEAEIAKVTALAYEMACANVRLQKIPVVLAPTERFVDEWRTPITTNPFDVPVREKVERLLHVNRLARDAGADFCDSFMWFVNEWKYLASSEGSRITQDLYRAWGEAVPTVIDKTTGLFETRKTLTAPMGTGFEYLHDYPFEQEIEVCVEHAKMKLAAPSVKPGRRDLIIHPSNLWLTIHETCGHPSELDRALGYEANFAGTSFMTVDKLGKLRYGSEIVNIFADRTEPGGLSTCGYDDDGVRTSSFPIIEKGIFVDYQTTREQASYIGQHASHGCAYADSYARFPIQRMPNISLQPGPRERSLEDIIADTEEGVLVVGDNSWSIDQQRFNFQFTAQEFWEIRNGKRVGMVRDMAYQGNTVEFWNSCDALGGPATYELGGSFFCGKGQPSQSAPVSHGCVPARFRNVNVLNTKTN